MKSFTSHRYYELYSLFSADILFPNVVLPHYRRGLARSRPSTSYSQPSGRTRVPYAGGRRRVDGDRHPEWVRVYVSWIFPSRLYRRLTNSLSGTPAALSSQTISRSSATEATEAFSQLTTQHTIIPFIQYSDFF
jgi:hypothetical protein